MGESGRNPELPVVFRCEENPDPLTESRGFTAQVNRHVEYFAGNGPDQLPLGPVYLVVQAPERTPGGFTLVVLNKFHVEPPFLEKGTTPGFHKIPALISVNYGFEDQHIGNPGLGDLHLVIRPGFFQRAGMLMSLQNSQQVLAVTAFLERFRQPRQLLVVDELLSPGNFLGTGNLQSLAFFEDANEIGGIQQ